MFKFIHVFIVVALMGVSGSHQAFAKANGNCITKPWQCKGWGVGNGGYKRDEPVAGAAHVSGKPVKDISKAHERYQKPVHRNGPCDSHMAGCIDHQ